MPLFSRNKDAKAASSSKATRTNDGRPRFRLGRWLRLHGVDIITMALAGFLGLGIYFAPPAYSRPFPITFQDGEIVYPEVAVPMQTDLVPIWLAAFLAFMLPFVFFCLFQIRIRSFDLLLTTTLGLLKSLITAALFQVFIKWIIGGLRPHFLVVCNPVIPAGVVGKGYKQLYFTREICTGDPKDINDAVESLPSGHATAAFAGFIFLSLYFNAQLKVLSGHNPAYWKMLLFMAPILGAMLIALAMTMDGFHHWWDITVGGLIGTACAFVAFRMTFASVWDFRFNHVCLPRTTSIFMRRPDAEANMLTFNYGLGQTTQWPVTREGGWGDQAELTGGAPFDASALGGAAGGAGGAGGGFFGGNGATGTGNTMPRGNHHSHNTDATQNV